MDKKLKKKIVLARNKRTQLILQHARQHQAEAERIAEEEEARRQALAKRGEAPEDEVWSAKTQEIRDRLTNRKRKARDRWNRFAGTSGGGGMGR